MSSITFDRHRTFKQDVVASNGVVTSNHPLGSIAGLEMFARGGNAVDALVAALFAVNVVEPMMVSIFGAGFFVLRKADGSLHTLDNYATAPGKSTPTMYRPGPNQLEYDTIDDENRVGYKSVGVPGALLGWCQMVERHGKLDLGTVMEPAIRFARDGWPVSAYLERCINQDIPNMNRFSATGAVFRPGGATPKVGAILKRTDFARTLERIARHGPAELYHGELGQMVANDMAANGGLITTKDLAEYQTKERAPVRGTYRGYEIVSMAPPSSGGTHIVQMLNLLEGFDVKGMGFGTLASTHLLAEVIKIAFEDRRAHMADSDRHTVPVDWLTSKRYADQRRPEIKADRATQYTPTEARVPVESNHTTHATAMDSDGNAVSATQTLNLLFGSRVTTPGTGMLLNDCMCMLDPIPGGINSIEPGKRILSSMSPTIVLKDGRPVMALGTPGGKRIFPAVFQAIVNVIDHGMTLQQAVEAPRVWTQGPVLELEETFANVEQLKFDLSARGHAIDIVQKVAGCMNGVQVDPQSGLLRGAACWRADGSPMGFSGGDARMSETTLRL